jgi:putative hemolysin
MRKAACLVIVYFLCGCANHTDKSDSHNGLIGMPNPASRFCVQSGGESIAKSDESGGIYRICKLKNGDEVNEWEYFRATQK